MTEEFVVKTSVSKIILHLIGCLIFVIGGIYIIYVEEDFYTIIIMMICSGFFGL